MLTQIRMLVGNDSPKHTKIEEVVDSEHLPIIQPTKQPGTDAIRKTKSQTMSKAIVENPRRDKVFRADQDTLPEVVETFHR